MPAAGSEVGGEQLLEGASTLALGVMRKKEQRVGSHSPLVFGVPPSVPPVDRQKPLLRHNTAWWLGAQVLKPESGFISHFHRIVALWHQAGLPSFSVPR